MRRSCTLLALTAFAGWHGARAQDIQVETNALTTVRLVCLVLRAPLDNASYT